MIVDSGQLRTHPMRLTDFSNESRSHGSSAVRRHHFSFTKFSNHTSPSFHRPLFSLFLRLLPQILSQLFPKMPFYSALLDAIPAYTGLSPAAFFTILALMIGVYRIVCGFFVAPEELRTEGGKGPVEARSWAPPPEPVQIGEVTEEELRAYDGSDPNRPLLMAIKGQIYDVSMSRMFYGPGGPYALFAGRDASRALALMSFDPNDLTGNIEGLNNDEIEVLNDWELKFMEKYVKVGQLVKEGEKRDISGEEKVEESFGPNQEIESRNGIAEVQA